MDISILGFNLIPKCVKVPLDDVLTALAESPLKTENHRIIAVIRQGHFWKGVILAIRDTQHFTKIRETENGRFTISAEQMEDGTRPVDFNFFVIDSRTNRGLYQHYFQSSSLNYFCWLLKQQYDLLRKGRSEAALKALGEDATNKAKTAAKAPFRGSLGYQLLARPESFQECVESLSRLKIFEFQLAEFVPVVKTFRALEGITKRVTHRFVFERYATGDAQRRSVLQFLKNSQLTRAKIIGIDPQGIEEIIHLHNDLASFGKYDYDFLVNRLLIDSENLPQTINTCAITEYLLKLLETSKVASIFSAMVPDKNN